ncbi:MAG: LysM peptidoglycan-binding domain-containing protein [Candidatus Cloacimonetes bacterium]|nr:LysM peptidoglycan-binding domain-containing protein [Candidatus Cloacimonadota bacterium]
MILKLNRLLWLWLLMILLIMPVLLAAQQTHTVKKGDTLYGLSKRYGTSVEQLMKLNKLSGSSLSIGQKLVVKAAAPKPKPKPKPKPAETPPAAPPETPPPLSNPPEGKAPPQNLGDEYYYTVKAKDNLFRIAQNHGVALAEMLVWNNFPNSSVQIHPGDQIIIKNPSGAPTEIPIKTIPVPEPTISVEKAAPDTVVIERVYVVQKKDTLFKIATSNGMTVDELKKLNNLSSNDLKVGQRIYLAGKPRPDDKKPLGENLTEEELQKRDKIRQDLILPVEGKVWSEYGLRNGRPHKGIDIGAKQGSPIYAVLDGTVVYSGVQGAYGNVVVIEHPDFVMTVYAHNEKNLVSVNDKVRQGQQIATIGATGNARGAHVHFEYRLKGKAINPRKVLPLK